LRDTASSAWIFFFVNDFGNPDAFHPNADGYAAYVDAIKTKLPGGWLDKPLI
jgi:lysophospholipase L1-like esterase